MGPIQAAISTLNSAQKQAATHIDGALLILAGAGSGKTKTITTRLAYLIEEVGIPPSNTLTLTFTNKAAREMRERALSLLNNTQVAPPRLCTFHHFGLLFLRLHIQLLNRSNIFSVIDEDDKRKILRNIKKNLQKEHNHIELSPTDIATKISLAKNRNFDWDVESIFDNLGNMIQICKEYEKYLIENNLVDFDDLLLLPHRILSSNSNLCKKISQTYQYIMVDEYQDTNDLQVAILKKLCTTHSNLCVVGDDDQSIYSWRGANIGHILNFNKTFFADSKEVKTVKLEQNYRSTKKILNIANNLIAHNAQRYNKILKATKLDGCDVNFLKSQSDKEEMRKIIESIYNLISNGDKYDDIAILFRLNGIARNVEQELNRAKIPFKMIGVMRFYERQEIKDCVAYLRLGINPNDSFSLNRVLNQPKRGIGNRSLEEIFKKAHNNKGVYDTYKQGLYSKYKYNETLKDFFDIIESIQDSLQTNPKEISHIFKTKINLYASGADSKDFKKDNEVENAERRENINEFLFLLDEFIEENKYISGSDILQDFLNNIALSSSSDDLGQGCVKCMSVHNSKGLEFKHIFVIGLEEGLFPFTLRNEYDSNDKAISQKDIAEERRLCYVAFTRAKDSLSVSYARERFYRNGKKSYKPSRFLLEAGLLTEEQMKALGYKESESEALSDFSYEFDTNISLDSKQSESKNIKTPVKFVKGMRVKHKLFGEGRIIAIDGKDTQCKLKISFAGLERIILASFVQAMDESE